MVSPTYWFMKFMICFVLLCTFVRISSTRSLLVDDDDDEQTQIDNSFFNNYAATSGRFAKTYPHGFDLPDSLYDHRQQQLLYQNKPYNPDNIQLSKRIIMLPRVGRRSIRSILNK